MEGNHGFKHSCKFCKKRFSCGRALGGHMRSHMTMNTAETEEKLQKKKNKLVDGGDSPNNYVGFEESANSGYGLRENPKKTWRISDPVDSSLFGQVNRVCKDCGKGFQSLKALFGHMRCHSEKLSRSVETDSWSEEQKPKQTILDSQSDNEGAPKKTRSRRTTAAPRYGVGSSSFSVSDEQQEQEEQEQLAICLMMLSRDVGISRAIVVADSSDNNSASVEVRSGLGKGVKKKPLNGVFDHGSESRKLEFDVSDNDFLRNGVNKLKNVVSDHGFSRNGVNKLKNVVSDNGFARDELKKSQFDVSDTEFRKGFGVSHAEFVADESGFEVSDTELEQDSIKKTRIDSSNVELSRNSRRKPRFDSSYTELERHSIKKTRLDCSETELGKDSYKRPVYNGFDSGKKNRYEVSDSDLRASFRRSKLHALGTELGKDHYERSKYECTTCNKIFHSYQALGGHRASHKKVKGCFARIETSENSIETDLSPDQGASMGHKIKSCKIETLFERGGINRETTKSKIHECPICLRVFSSGQALGGHKRSHMVPVGNSEIKDGSCSTIVVQPKMPEISDLLDLNLPAPIDEEVHSHVGFESWCSETQFVADKDFHSLTTPPRPCLQV